MTWLGGMLSATFVILKLTEYVAWSWGWVLAPVWSGLSFDILLTVAVLLGLVTAGRKFRRSLKTSTRLLSTHRDRATERNFNLPRWGRKL